MARVLWQAMTARPRHVSMPGDLWDRIDQARGDVPLSRWMARAAEARLPDPVSVDDRAPTEETET